MTQYTNMPANRWWAWDVARRLRIGPFDGSSKAIAMARHLAEKYDGENVGATREHDARGWKLIRWFEAINVEQALTRFPRT